MNNSISKTQKTIMEEVTDKLTDLVQEKYIVEDILNMKYAMEHKERMVQICKSINEMTCVVLNTINGENIEEPLQTHIIFHERMEEDIQMDEAIEYYIFAFQQNELDQFRYINRIIERKGEIFLDTKEYIGLYDIGLYNTFTIEESNL